MPDAVGQARGGVGGSGLETSLPGPWAGGSRFYTPVQGGRHWSQPHCTHEGMQTPKRPQRLQGWGWESGPSSAREPSP